jgi:hypothetical protein
MLNVLLGQNTITMLADAILDVPNRGDIVVEPFAG